MMGGRQGLTDSSYLSSGRSLLQQRFRERWIWIQDSLLPCSLDYRTLRGRDNVEIPFQGKIKVFMLCHEDTLSCYLKINTLNLKNADPCISRVRQYSTLKRLLLFLYKVIYPNRFSDSCLSRTARQLQQSVQVTFHFD